MKNSCFECGRDIDLVSHHVVPRSLGGTKTNTLSASKTSEKIGDSGTRWVV